jgi:serine/threonine protein kinase
MDSPEDDPLLKLRGGQVVKNASTGRWYRVGSRIGSGGFGAVYRVSQSRGRKQSPSDLCLKVASAPDNWHREAYFGNLLQNEPGVIQVLESFAWARAGSRSRPLYCLITEYAAGGDLRHYLDAHPEPWSEHKARAEVARLLRVVSLLHVPGAVHRDITPGNVFVTLRRTLKLGDFGIAVHPVGQRSIPADVFHHWFVETRMRQHAISTWRPADDVYQVGQVLAALLLGRAARRATSKDIKAVSCSAQTKVVLQRSIGNRSKRFASANEMLRALQVRRGRTTKRVGIDSLEGKRVVFTGPLSIPRKEAVSPTSAVFRTDD